jgi:hypothetical protein
VIAPIGAGTEGKVSDPVASGGTVTAGSERGGMLAGETETERNGTDGIVTAGMDTDGSVTEGSNAGEVLEAGWAVSRRGTAGNKTGGPGTDRDEMDGETGTRTDTWGTLSADSVDDAPSGAGSEMPGSGMSVGVEAVVATSLVAGDACNTDDAAPAAETVGTDGVRDCT